jgi:5'-3' exonuclease
MGIPSYFVHIVKTYPAIIKEFVTNKTKIDNFYIDSNSIIYDAIKTISYKKEDKMYEKKVNEWICNKLLSYILLINPIKKVFIAFDGVAPVAKLDQQRNRRYTTWYVNNFLEKEAQHSTEREAVWDTTSITPGSNFMKTLNAEIKVFFQTKLPKLEIIISGSEYTGEGEHKIYNYMRKHAAYHKNTSTIIYGLDADLIMLSLIHLSISDNIYLFRETPHFISSINNRLKPNCLYVFDIFELNDKISIEMKSTNTLDYIFLCFLLGNDFLPHFPALNIRTNGIQILLDVYNSNALSIIQKDGTIHWRNLRRLIEQLAKSEVELCKIESNKRDALEKRLNETMNPNTSNTSNTSNTPRDEATLMNLPILDRSVEKYINIGENGWQQRYYKELFDIEITDERTQELCINYLEGLEWTFKYYTNNCPDWRWRYKYKYPPLLEDLYKYIPHCEMTFIEKNTNQPVSQELQLCYVLPRNSLHLLPEATFKKLIHSKPENYRLDYMLKYAYCRYLWEGHVELPEININELETIIK